LKGGDFQPRNHANKKDKEIRVLTTEGTESTKEDRYAKSNITIADNSPLWRGACLQVGWWIHLHCIRKWCFSFILFAHQSYPFTFQMVLRPLEWWKESL